ncbi:MAG: hypothetical protein MR016_08370 [Agathobacter sp.]|nr:hypothetical protein [Agathobacter sp.]
MIVQIVKIFFYYWCGLLSCFTTDYGQFQGGYPDRVNIPLTDDEAHITFYILKR